MAKFRVWVDPGIRSISIVVDAENEAAAEKFVYENYSFDDLLECCGLRACDVEYDIVEVNTDDVDEED